MAERVSEDGGPFRRRGRGILYSLREEGRALDFGLLYDIRKELDWQLSYPEALVGKVDTREYKDHYLLVRVRDEATRELVRTGLAARYPDSLYDVFSAPDMDYYVIKNRPEDIFYTPKTKLLDKNSKESKEVSVPAVSLAEEIGLGFDPAKIRTVQQAGLEVIPRSINYIAYPEKLVSAYKKDLERLGITPAGALHRQGGHRLPGSSGRADGLSEGSPHRRRPYRDPGAAGQIEQADIVALTRDLDYHAVRAFSVLPYIQKRYQFYNYEGAEEIENTLYRAVTERNIRMIYFKPFKFDDRSYVTDLTEYQKTFKSLEARLKPHGISIGPFSVMPENAPSTALRILLASGLWGALLMACGAGLLRPAYRWGLLLAGVLAAAGLYRVAPALAGELTALGSAIFFPSLGGYYLIRSMKAMYVSDRPASLGATVFQGLGVLAVTTALSLLGGLVVGGALSGSEYLLEMQIFRGVKLSQLLPLAVVTGIYLLAFGYRRSRQEIQSLPHFASDLKAILFEDIKIYYIVLAGIAGAVGYVYIARTGHESSLQPSDLEMISRNFLEMVLLARPRTKEFLLAFPIIVAGFVFARYHLKKLIYPAALCGMIGLTSIANTFSHLRTPVYLSVVRTGYSISFGALIGVLAAVVLWFLISLLGKRIRSLVE